MQSSEVHGLTYFFRRISFPTTKKKSLDFFGTDLMPNGIHQSLIHGIFQMISECLFLSASKYCSISKELIVKITLLLLCNKYYHNNSNLTLM